MSLPPLRTRVKICGIIREDDALCAAAAGADALGFNFYAASPRAIAIEQAKTISACLPPFVSTVALFVNATPAAVDAVIAALRPALLQFHGDEDPAYCGQFGWPFIKAIRVARGTSAVDLLKYAQQFHAAHALLLDTFSQSAYGGTGERFDWQVIPPTLRSRIVLSGGLHAENVADAIAAIRPSAVDVSSGVELAGAPKGVKDHAKITQFLKEVRHADSR